MSQGILLDWTIFNWGQPKHGDTSHIIRTTIPSIQVVLHPFKPYLVTSSMSAYQQPAGWECTTLTHLATGRVTEVWLMAKVLGVRQTGKCS